MFYWIVQKIRAEKSDDFIGFDGDNTQEVARRRDVQQAFEQLGTICHSAPWKIFFLLKCPASEKYLFNESAVIFLAVRLTVRQNRTTGLQKRIWVELKT